MADGDYRTVDRSASAVAWIALLIAVAAMVLGWLAYNRTGEDLENKIQRAVNSAVTTGSNQASDAIDSAENAADNGPDGVDDGAQ